MTEEAPVKKKRKALKIALACVAAIPLVLLGLGLFLRSASGERFLFSQMASILAAQGFQIEAKEFAGRLPGRLYLRGLKISDADGVIATVGEAELLLRWRELFNRVAHIERLEIKNPEIWRLPKPPEKAREETDEKLSLPGALVLDELNISGGMLRENALAAVGFYNKASGFSVHLMDSNFGEAGNFGPLEKMPLLLGLYFTIDDLAALSPQFSGSVAGEFGAVGSLTELLLGLKLGSHTISTPQGMLENLNVNVEMAGSPMGPQWAGDVRLNAQSSPIGGFALETDWRVNIESGLRVELKSLRGNLGSASFLGDLAADLRGQEPALNGSISVSSINPDSWDTGFSLAFEPDIVLSLAAGENGQSLTLDMAIPELAAAQKKTDNLLCLKESTGRVRASDIFGAMDLEADIALGPGLTGPAWNCSPVYSSECIQSGRCTQWSGVTLKSSGSKGNGVFNIDLKGLTISGLGGEARDGLRTAGAYNLNEKSLSINNFALSLASYGLTLNSPTRFSFGENISLSPSAFTVLPTGTLKVAAALSGAGADTPLNAALDWSGPIEPLWQLLGQPDRHLRGAAAIHATATGTLNKPVPQGTVYVAGARYEDTLLGLTVSDINIEAHSTPNDLLTSVISAKDSRGGALALEAGLKRGDKGLELSAKGQLARFNPLQRDDISLYLSGDIGAEGPLERPRLTSNLTVDRGELDLRVLLASQSIPTLTIAKGEGAAPAENSRGPRFDLNVTVPNQFFIRGYGLDTEWRGNLNIGGFAARPSLSGRLAPVRGVFEIFSRQFTLGSGDISFNGGVDPILNLELENSGPNITALIKISGSGSAPSLAMSSRPPQPEEEVLAQVLFGKRASDLGRFEALQLAAGLSELSSFKSGGFSLDPIGSVRKELGLDVLRVGGAGGQSTREVSDISGSLGQDMSGPSGGAGDDAGATTVEAGKYISDKVYAGVEQSASGGSAFRVEMELTPLMSLEARTSTESSQVGLGWKKDY